MKERMKLIKGVLIFMVLLVSCETEEDDEDMQPDNNGVQNVDVSPFIELNTLGGSVSFAEDIGFNTLDEPVVVGETRDAEGNTIGFSAEIESGMVEKGNLYGNYTTILGYFEGIHAGYSEDDAGNERPVVTLFDDPPYELEMGDDGTQNGRAVAGNASGSIIGNAYVAFVGANTPVIWEVLEGEIIQVLDSSGTSDISLIDINDNDRIIGFSDNSNTGYHWSYQDGFVEIQASGYDYVKPVRINNNGKVACNLISGTNSSTPAIYDIQSDSFTELPLLSGGNTGSVYGLNNNDEAVGQVGLGLSITPVYWDGNGNVLDLNSVLDVSESEHDQLGYNTYVISAIGINDAGDIAGDGYFNLNDPENAGFGSRQREAYILPAGTY